MGKPSSAFVDWLVPVGHDAAHFLGGMAVSIVTSIIFYGVIAWIILAVWARAHREGPDQSGSLPISR
jgi:hypothetical protein